MILKPPRRTYLETDKKCFKSSAHSRKVELSPGISFQSTIAECEYFLPPLRLVHPGKPSSQRSQTLSLRGHFFLLLSRKPHKRKVPSDNKTVHGAIIMRWRRLRLKGFTKTHKGKSLEEATSPYLIDLYLFCSNSNKMCTLKSR